MDLQIDGALHRFIPIKQFRAEQALPDRFGVDAFTPKDWTELGRLDSAGTELNELRVVLLASLPSHLTPTGWMNQLPDYVRQFDNGLRGLNAQVGLRESEIEFAVGDRICSSRIERCPPCPCHGAYPWGCTSSIQPGLSAVAV